MTLLKKETDEVDEVLLRGILCRCFIARTRALTPVRKNPIAAQAEAQPNSKESTAKPAGSS